MLHITLNVHLVLPASAPSPSDLICSHLTRQKRFCINVANWLLLVYVLLSEASKEQVVCNEFALNCGHPTLKYCSLHSLMSYTGLNYCINGRFQDSFSAWSFAPPEYVFKCFFATAMAEFYHWCNFSFILFKWKLSFPYNPCIRQLGISKNTKYHEKCHKPKRDNHIHHLFYTPTYSLASGSGPTV